MVEETAHLIDQVLNEIDTVLHKVDVRQIDQTIKLITKNKRIFVLGSGRSGFAAKGFAMRLMHIGYQVYVVGETITPSIQKNDLLVVVSGSGETRTVLDLAKMAHDKGVKMIAITSNVKSSLAKLADGLLQVPGTTKNGDGINSIQLLSTLFDQSAQIVMDILCLKLSMRDEISDEEAKSKHSNIE